MNRHARSLVHAGALRLVAAAVTLSLGSGCSFLFVTPARNSTMRVVNTGCTNSDALPMVDAVLAAFQLIATTYTFLAPEASFQNAPYSRETGIAFGLTFTAVFTGSAIYGFSKVGECIDVLEENSQPPPARRRRPAPKSQNESP